MKQQITLLEIFNLGVDYGQFIMEDEIFHKNWADMMGIITTNRKFSMNSQIIIRQPHSDEWLKAKQKSYKEMFDLLEKFYKKEIEII